MKVRELIEFLSKFDPEAEVISAGPDIGGYHWEFGTVTDATTYKKALQDESDLSESELDELRADGECLECPCIYYSGNH